MLEENVRGKQGKDGRVSGPKEGARALNWREAQGENAWPGYEATRADAERSRASGDERWAFSNRRKGSASRHGKRQEPKSAKSAQITADFKHYQTNPLLLALVSHRHPVFSLPLSPHSPLFRRTATSNERWPISAVCLSESGSFFVPLLLLATRPTNTPQCRARGPTIARHPQRHLWVSVDLAPLRLIEQILCSSIPPTSTSRVPAAAAKKTNAVRVVDDREDDGDDEDNQRVWDHACVSLSSLSLLGGAANAIVDAHSQEYPRPRAHARPSPVYSSSSASARPPPAAALQPALHISRRPSPSSTPTPAPAPSTAEGAKEALREREPRCATARERILDPGADEAAARPGMSGRGKPRTGKSGRAQAWCGIRKVRRRARAGSARDGRGVRRRVARRGTGRDALMRTLDVRAPLLTPPQDVACS
ncbi:hypothetical protein C8R45DRAFT_1106173 [Mycena sanguinolenta]|nr:hypothetical protein C8R45DRAFT_1106173 [Mycena sanguinolenta]